MAFYFVIPGSHNTMKKKRKEKGKKKNEMKKKKYAQKMGGKENNLSPIKLDQNKI